MVGVGDVQQDVVNEVAGAQLVVEEVGVSNNMPCDAVEVGSVLAKSSAFKVPITAKIARI